MKDALISSAVLILALTALRFLFRNRISRRLQYALWGLVLLRLALPIPLPGARFSVMTGAERLSGQAATFPAPAVSPALTVPPVSNLTLPPPQMPAVNSQSGSATRSVPPSKADLLLFAWLAGMGLTLGCFLASNLRFSRRLRRTRTRFDTPGCPLPVYVSEAAVSPCLFGLFRPAVYLTPRAAEALEPTLRHVLTHELCHYRHGDHVWSALRCLLLSVYWFNPLVWLAAALSRVDGEQACDEAAIRALGEEQRLSYGKTLIDMIAVRPAPSGLLCTATTMVSGTKSLKKRLERIVRRQKPLLWALVLTLLLAAALAGCTFTGAKKGTVPGVPGNIDGYTEVSDSKDGYIEYTETIQETENISGYDIYRFHYNVDASPQLTIWAEYWEDGGLASSQSLTSLDLSGGPGDLEVGFQEWTDPAFWQKTEDGFRTIEFLSTGPFGLSSSSLSVPIDSSFNGRSTSWLGSGSENRCDVTVKEPIVLLCLAYQQANSGALHAYDCEYLMENPEAVKEYKRAVLVKCAFADKTGRTPPLPSVAEPGDKTVLQSDYAVTLIKGGEERPVTGFDPSLPEAAVFDGLVKSAAWPSTGITDRPYAFHIRRTLTTEDGPEVSDHYAYRLDDGKAAIMSGTFYSMLSEDLMAQLEEAAGIEPGQIYNLDAAISKAILQHAGGQGELQTEAHEVLATIVDDRSDSSQVTAYCMVLDLSFDSDGKTLTQTGGSHMPVAISFSQSLDGAYTLAEYWTPEDGTYYAPSIREKFPSGIAEDAIDTQKYSLSQTQSCYAQAIAWFGLDLTEEIAGRIAVLCDTPNWEEPSPYVEPGYLDYRQLLFYGDETLRYVFGEFLKGNQSGERAHVLHRLMQELLGGENIDAEADNGQDYFDQWKAHVLQRYESNGLNYFREHAPKSYLLLDVMGMTRPQVMDAPALN